jgi:putative ABC transport system permease protein
LLFSDECVSSIASAFTRHVNFFTELKEGLAISWSAIRANKMRSILTTLGIVIGIVTVTLMGTAIEGVNHAFLKAVSFIGADVLFVQREDWSAPDTETEWLKVQKRRHLTLEQFNALERDLTLAGALAPLAFDELPIKYEKRSADGVQIIGSNEQLLLTGGISISDGRFISAAEAEGGRPVCVIGYAVATNLFVRESPLGKKVMIGQRPFDVIGVLEKQGDMFGQFDNQAIIPLRQMMAAFLHTRDVEIIEVKVKDVARVADAREELHSVMRRIRHLAPGDQDDFAINQQEQILEIVHRVTAVIGGIGLFITGLSLFVGGIGIMNIMFVSVAERTREIGIRKAIGAKRRTILLQFLSEAAAICMIGGAIALAIAWPLTLVMREYVPATLSVTVVGLALLVALATGVVSGLAPAWRAARLNPVDALRSGE